jgi:hypothetical protein
MLMHTDDSVAAIDNGDSLVKTLVYGFIAIR